MQNEVRHERCYYTRSVGWVSILFLSLSLLLPPVSHAVSGVNDYNGDLVSDLAMFNLTSGQWYIRTANGITLAWGVSWGFAGGVPVIGDYDGDGKSDLAIYDTRNGDWYIRTMSGTVLAWRMNWGGADMVPVPGDYNNDGAWDLAVFQRSTGDWYIKTLSGSVLAWKLNWGGATMRPASGDFNGDGFYDLAVVQLMGSGFNTVESKWYAKTLSGNVLKFGEGTFHFASRVIPVLGDVSGDGSHDYLTYSYLYREYASSYYGDSAEWLRNSYVDYWGTRQMTPVCGDYNADLMSDLACFDRSTFKWYIKARSLYGTGANIVYGQQWGGPGMVPVGGPLDYRTSFVIEKSTGGVHPWNSTLPGYLRPSAGKTPVRVVLDGETTDLVQTCSYTLGSRVRRYRYQLNFRLINNKGVAISSSFVQGSSPPSCPYFLSGGSRNHFGGHVTSADLNAWLANLVATY